MPLSSALRFLAVWSGLMALVGSRPVNVCLQTLYGLNSGVFLSTLLHIPYPNRGVVWRSIQSVFTRLLTQFIAYFSAPPGYVHLYVAYYQPISAYGLLFSPPKGPESEYKSALSRHEHALT